jgi:hypothetical protein
VEIRGKGHFLEGFSEMVGRYMHFPAVEDYP